MEVNSLKVLCTSLPGRYALALFNEGKKAGCLDEITDNFKKLEIFFSKNKAIGKLLTSKCISDKELDNGWLAVATHLSFCPVFTSFLREVGQNRRFNILNKIKYVYRVAFSKYKNKRSVAVTTAVELLPEQQKRVENIISRLFSEKTMVVYKINPNILGGVKISSEEKVYDASVQAQLKQLTKFLNNVKVS